MIISYRFSTVIMLHINIYLMRDLKSIMIVWNRCINRYNNTALYSWPVLTNLANNDHVTFSFASETKTAATRPWMDATSFTKLIFLGKGLSRIQLSSNLQVLYTILTLHIIITWVLIAKWATSVSLDKNTH